MTDIVDTTTPALTTKSLQITTREEETAGTERLLVSTKIIKTSTSPSVTQNISQSKTMTRYSKVESYTTPWKISTRNTTLKITITPAPAPTVKIVRTPAPFATIDDVDSPKHYYNETQGKIHFLADRRWPLNRKMIQAFLRYGKPRNNSEFIF